MAIIVGSHTLHAHAQLSVIVVHSAAPPHLIEKPQDVQKPIDDSLVWECKATGKPKPSYRWMKNGENIEPVEVSFLQKVVKVRLSKSTFM